MAIAIDGPSSVHPFRGMGYRGIGLLSLWHYLSRPATEGAHPFPKLYRSNTDRRVRSRDFLFFEGISKAVSRHGHFYSGGETFIGKARGLEDFPGRIWTSSGRAL